MTTKKTTNSVSLLKFFFKIFKLKFASFIVTTHFVLLVTTMIMMMCVRSGRIRGCDPWCREQLILTDVGAQAACSSTHRDGTVQLCTVHCALY